MSQSYRIGEHVSWNSEVGRVRGTITKVHREDFTFLGRRRHASEDEPQYEISSDKTKHLAAHKGSALRRLRRRYVS